MDDKLPRYREVRDRALRRRAAAIGALALVPGMTLAACANGDAALEAQAATDTTSTTSVDTTAATTTTVIDTTSTTSVDTTTSSAEPGTAITAGSELTVDFTYAASSSGRVHNPYIAVWIEDEDGELVQTLSVWWMQSQKGTKWLSDLRRWITVDGSTDTLEALSGATRTPGDYSLVWDGTDLDGDLVEEGTYYVCIEAAREHGPYSLVRESVELGAQGLTTALTANGELSGIEVAFDVA